MGSDVSKLIGHTPQRNSAGLSSDQHGRSMLTQRTRRYSLTPLTGAGMASSGISGLKAFPQSQRHVDRASQIQLDFVPGKFVFVITEALKLQSA